jgi:transcriptional regulator GlxA family with amidase domain
LQRNTYVIIFTYSKKDNMTTFSARSVNPVKTVVILAFPGVTLLDIAGPAQVFNSAILIAKSEGKPPPYYVVVASIGASKNMVTDTGISLEVETLEGVKEIDTLIIPGGPGIWDAIQDKTLVTWISKQSSGTRRTASVCLGAFMLAHAGILDGRRATTHWRYCEALQRYRPSLRVETNPIFIKDGPIWTSAGVSSGIDLALAMVEEDLGHTIALDVARRLVVFLKRPGGQNQFSAVLAAQFTDTNGMFSDLHAWIADNLALELNVNLLAERVGMSVRNFSRTYIRHTGSTPSKAIEALRVEAAKRLLESDHSPSIFVIARKCGFGDDERMRRTFLRHVGVAPLQYKTHFSNNFSSDASPKR